VDEGKREPVLETRRPPPRPPRITAFEPADRERATRDAHPLAEDAHALAGGAAGREGRGARTGTEPAGRAEREDVVREARPTDGEIAGADGHQLIVRAVDVDPGRPGPQRDLPEVAAPQSRADDREPILPADREGVGPVRRVADLGERAGERRPPVFQLETGRIDEGPPL